MKNLSLQIYQLIEKYQYWNKVSIPKEGIPLLHVDEVASAIASFYEKIRGIIDWKEEHLLRKSAIERSLKRRFLVQLKTEEIPEPFLLELIRGGHFPNNRIEESKVELVKIVIDKYLFISQNSYYKSEGEKLNLFNWLISIAACEIEEILMPAIREKALIDFMTETITERVEIFFNKVIYKAISKDEIKEQVYIAVHRALFKLDSPIISYHLLQKRYPEWKNLRRENLDEFVKKINLIKKEIERSLNHPLANKFYKICEKYDTVYLILGDIISQNISDIEKKLSNPVILEELIKRHYQERLKKLKNKISRAAFYSTISIFITKILIALSLEIPFDKYITGGFNYQTLALNVLIPPLLMFFLVLTIKTPRKENLGRVVIETMKIVYKDKNYDIYPIKLPRKRGIVFNTIMFIFYFITFTLSFGFIIWILNKLNFSIFSTIIFIVFFSLIMFTGTKIRERAKELNVVEEKENFLSFFVDSFSLPFLQFGKWLSIKWAKFNVIILLINALIDLPFQLFAEFLEHWRNFLKEKKEEIR